MTTATPAGGNVVVPKRPLRTLDELSYCEVTEQELDQLEKSFRDSKNSAMFASTALGICVSCGVTALMVDSDKYLKRWLLLVMFTVISGIVTIAKGLTARNERHDFEKVMNRVRGRSELVKGHGTPASGLSTSANASITTST